MTTVATSPEEELSNLHSKIPKCDDKTISVMCIENRIKSFFRTVSTVDTLNVTDSVQILKKNDSDGKLKSLDSVNENTSLLDEINRFARNRVVKIKLSKDMFSPRESRTFFGGK